jgi:two-component system LytT family sensor kinase
MQKKDLQRAEFWIATILYVFAIVALISNVSSRSAGYVKYDFKEYRIPFSYFSNYFVPEIFRYSILYFSFLLLNFCVIPSLVKKTNEVLNYSLIFILVLFIGLILGVCKTYSEAYQLVQYDTLQQAYNRIFFSSYSYAIWLVILISAYGLLKEIITFLIDNKQRREQNPNQIKIDIGIGLAFWFVGSLLWITTRSALEIMVIWTLVIFAAIGIVVYAIHYLLPSLAARPRRFRTFFWQIFFISLLLAVPMSLIGLFFFYGREEVVFITFLFHVPTQLVISVSLSWFLFKNRQKSSNELNSLRTELGRSDASLSFLQSQINPHFLFNALNTLYGTALQENAERTGEGIQKLGDMMRFMLHENVQDKISLTRDVDYLENYISLQKLRTSRSSAIVIETQIDEQLNNFQIAPMLLIPFVENAFKHGISLQHPSHIKITLQTRDNTLYFDVHNSIHLKPDNDPEKLKSGIGLVNVKQRLALLYPGKHELIIRESAKEFFIHLTLQL